MPKSENLILWDNEKDRNGCRNSTVSWSSLVERTAGLGEQSLSLSIEERVKQSQIWHSKFTASQDRL